MKIIMKILRIALVVAVSFGMLSPVSSVFAKEKEVITVPKKLFGGSAKKKDSGEVVILTNDDITLDGLVDSVELYYEVPTQSIKKGSKLNLQIQYSDLLLKDSTLTVVINDKPVQSERLQRDKDKMNIQVPLEGDAVTQGIHTVTIDFYGHIAKELCTNTENPANWLTILSTSNVFLNTEELVERENMLEDYPYPFIQNAQDKEIQGTIVIPDEASTSILSSSLRLANYLSRQAAEGEEVEIVRESQLKDISTHIIAIGTKKQWKGIIKDLYDQANLSVSENELVMSNHVLKFPKAMKQAMFITALEEEVISNKIAVLTEPDLIEQLAGSSLSINKAPVIPDIEAKGSNLFKELGIINQTLTGLKGASQNYFYQIPAYANLYADAAIHLKLKVSETLFNKADNNEIDDDAELVVYVNGVPHSIEIDALKKQGDNTIYDVEIPIESSILRQQAFLNIQFKAHGLKQSDLCVPPDEDKWVFIQDNSSIHIDVVSDVVESNFTSWPAPFISAKGLNDTMILLPDKYDETMINQLQLLTNLLGNQVTWDGLEFVFEKNVDEEALKERHVIVLGAISEHPSLEAYKDELLVSMDESKQLDVSEFQFINESSKYVAWLQHSVWDKNQSMAVFAPIDGEKAEQFLGKNLLDYLNTSKMNTNIIVESSNGEVFSNELEEDADQVESNSENGEKEEAKPINGWMIGSFVSIVLLSIIIFIYFYHRRKK